MPEWVGANDDENGYYYYPVSITCSERDAESDSWPKLNNGCSVKIGKTNASGITKFTVSYIDNQGNKQTVSHSWRDDEGGVDFTANGHSYWFNWDATPYGAWLEVDPVYDSKGEWQSSASMHFYVIDVKKSGDVAVPVEWQKARTLNGLYGEGCDYGVSDTKGTAQLKCGKANKKGIAKVSLTITPFNGKKRLYKSVSVDVSQGGAVEVSWPQQKYRVAIDGDEFFGEPIYGESRPACSPNAVWNADVGGALRGEAASFSVRDFSFPADKGFSVLDGLVPQYTWDGSGDGAEPVFVNKATGKWSFRKSMAAKFIKYLKGMPSVACCDAPDGFYVLNLECDCRAGEINNSSLKLTYNPKTGIFKGSFLIYAVEQAVVENLIGLQRKPTLKKYKANVTGVVVDGKGYGQAICKKPAAGPWAVAIE